MIRGIITGNRIGTDGLSFHGAIQHEDVVRWLLYWDKIIYTGLGVGGASISGNHSDDVTYLESLGVFSTEIVDLPSIGEVIGPPPVDNGIKMFGIPGNQIPYVSAAARLHLCKTLSDSTGGIWSLGQAGGETLLLPGVNESKDLLDVNLYNCLPIPTHDTPFEDILNYKEKYSAELTRLRFALDKLRENVLHSQDQRRALDSALHELSISLQDIDSSISGTGIQTFKDSISLYTENPSIGFWSVLGGVVGASQGIPIEIAASAGLTIPTLFTFIKRNILGGNNLPSAKNDFTYVFNIRKGLL